ncbi:MAG: tetraacyldisaccharide 4'-kinase [Chitinophagales bacterium]
MSILNKIILSPFALLYAMVIAIRNFLYKKRFFRSVKFGVPVICIGNLSTGGTGKTPHIDYLIATLKHNYSVGVISRGYRRKTTGYAEVQTNSKAIDVGDEPLLLKWRHPEAHIAVSESRAFGIPKLVHNKEENFVVLLDDAFQHRAVRAGLNILLTKYNDLYIDNQILPLGNLREFKSGADRADIIIVTNTPKDISKEDKNAIVAKLKPKSYQYVLFSNIVYQKTYYIQNNQIKFAELEKDSSIILVSGIANNNSLVQYLENKYANVYQRKFSDHHQFTAQDVESIISTYKNTSATKKYLLTTEKDLTRLLPFIEEFNKNEILIHCLPIRINFAPEEREKFDKLIHFFVDTTLEEYLNQE